MHFVYILYSDTKKKYYCGESADIEDRLRRHNAGFSKSTKSGVPWALVRAIPMLNRSEAVKLERQIKKRGISRWLEAQG
jgi:putative endonuclease